MRNTPPVISTVRAMTNKPLRGISMESVRLTAPISHSGGLALTSRAPKIERSACCITSDNPQVASSVSRGRWYKRLIITRSTTQPSEPATRNDKAMAKKK
ncbi:hypothetical protein D3C73_1260310 [compost metagenome]